MCLYNKKIKSTTRLPQVQFPYLQIFVELIFSKLELNKVLVAVKWCKQNLPRTTDSFRTVWSSWASVFYCLGFANNRLGSGSPESHSSGYPREGPDQLDHFRDFSPFWVNEEIAGETDGRRGNHSSWKYESNLQNHRHHRRVMVERTWAIPAKIQEFHWTCQGVMYDDHLEDRAQIRRCRVNRQQPSSGDVSVSSRYSDGHIPRKRTPLIIPSLWYRATKNTRYTDFFLLSWAPIGWQTVFVPCYVSYASQKS